MSSDDEEELRKALDAELLQVTERVGKNKSKATNEDEPKERKKKKKSSSKKRKKKKKDSDSEEDDISEDDEDDFLGEEHYAPAPKKKAAPKEPATPSAAVPLKKRKASADDDDLPAEEEGEIGGTKGAADEESSELEPFNDGYDSDLMGDDDDRVKLAKLTEREREQVLAERYERRRELKEQWEARRRAKDEKHGRKGKRVPSTPRGDTLSAKKRGTASAFAELRARRANKVSTPRARRTADEDEDGDDYVDEDEDKRPAATPSSSTRRERESAPVEKTEEEQDATPEQVQTICLRRDQLVKWHYQPFFEKFAPGFLVRIGIGKTRSGEAVYRVAEIVEVKDGREHREYKFGGRATRRVLVCRQGVAIRSFPMEVVSNSNFTPGELTRFSQATRQAGMPTLTVGVVKQKQQDLKIMENYTYTPEEVDRMVAQKERERANRRPLNAALERKAVADQLRILKQHMTERANAIAPQVDSFDGTDSQLDRPMSNADELDEREANERKLEDLTKRLGELDDWLQQEEEELAQRRNVDLTKINKRNNELNEKQLVEKRRLEAERHRTAGATGRDEKLDPFSRRPTAPTGMYISQRMLEEEKKVQAEAAAKKEAELEKATLRASLEHAEAADDHAGALGRELAEAVSKPPVAAPPRAAPLLSSVVKPLASPDTGAPKPPPGKTLSLNDYFNRLKRDNVVNK